MADFLSKRGISYTVAFADRELAETYHVWGYPTLYFVNRKGKIMQVYVGYSKDMEAEIEKQLLKML
jgi:thioredoxin-related protein